MRRRSFQLPWRTWLLCCALGLFLSACSQTLPPTPPKAKPNPVKPRQLSDHFVHPIPGARLTSSFASSSSFRRGRIHRGVDFGARIGTPVYASRSGVVLSADNTSLSADFGLAVLIQHGEQFQSLSAHLSRIDVRMGDWVEAGQQIGLVGATGRVTGPHLHFELWRNSHPQDPLHFLPVVPRRVAP